MENEIITCPTCGSEKESICIMEMDDMPMLIEGVVMPLRICVPVERCLDCDFQWTDHRAEKIRDAVHAIYYPETEKGLTHDKQ